MGQSGGFSLWLNDHMDGHVARRLGKEINGHNNVVVEDTVGEERAGVVADVDGLSH
jgi:hypothetical protein